MSQGLIPFQYEVEKQEGGMTALAGLPLYLDFIQLMGLRKLITDLIRARDGGQGYTDAEMIVTVVLLNLAGGEAVDDVNGLEEDHGFRRILRDFWTYGLSRKERRERERRWRKERKRTVPSASTLRGYLELFHDPEQVKLRQPHEAFIPRPNPRLAALATLIGAFIASVQARSPQRNATLDMDATLVETYKKAALYCYKKFKAYQPLNVYWAEQGQVLFSEFRDGNVPADYDLLRPFKDALALLPEGVKKVFLRSDTAGYVVELLKYCAEGKNERFKVIEFAVGTDVTESFKSAVNEIPKSEWRSLPGRAKDAKSQEWAEVCFVPNRVAAKKDGPVYRYVAIREPLEQRELAGMDGQMKFPFPTMDWGPVKYKVTGIVTNRDLPGEELIHWYRGRCGKSEEAHSIMKEDLAGGKLPSQLFGANAAWWQMMILAFNVNSAMKRLALGESWEPRRMKAIRFWLINLPGRVIERGRQVFVRLTGGHSSNEVLFEARRRMLCLCGSG
jgi:hypothetical protein